MFTVIIIMTTGIILGFLLKNQKNLLNQLIQ